MVMLMFVDNYDDDDLLCMDCNYLTMQWGVNRKDGYILYNGVNYLTLMSL